MVVEKRAVERPHYADGAASRTVTHRRSCGAAPLREALSSSLLYTSHSILHSSSLDDTMGVLSVLTMFAIVGFSIAVSLLITVPLTGALVRLRGECVSADPWYCTTKHSYSANYNPRGLRLDPEGNFEPHTGPVVTSFFGMLKRVKRIEVRRRSRLFLGDSITHIALKGLERIVQGAQYVQGYHVDPQSYP